jgi:hypothetical protein
MDPGTINQSFTEHTVTMEVVSYDSHRMPVTDDTGHKIVWISKSTRHFLWGFVA